MSHYKAIVLSGGSVQTISMLGSIQYCIEQNYFDSIHSFYGTSAGAYLSYLLCIGYSPLEIIIYLCKTEIIKNKNINILEMLDGKGIVDYMYIQKHFETLTLNRVGKFLTLKDIFVLFHKNLVITTYNWSLQKTIYLSKDTHPDMPCLVALKMSSSLPILFEPFKYMNHYYIDGGIEANFPIERALKDFSIDEILGITVNSVHDKIDTTSLEKDTVLEYMYKLYLIMRKHTNVQHSENNKNIIHLTNSVNLLNVFLTTKEILELFSSGFHKTLDHFSKSQEDPEHLSMGLA